MNISIYWSEVTTSLIGLFILIFIFIKLKPGRILFEWGALKKDNILVKREYWRYITAPFFHTRFVHLLGNIIGLYYAGLLLERKIGGIAFLAIFLIGNIIADVMFTFMFTFESSIGGSAGIYALIGVILVLCFKDENFLRMNLNTEEMNILLTYFVAGNFVNLKGFDTLFVHVIGFISGIIISIVWVIICG